jgi:hypothetical protein
MSGQKWMTENKNCRGAISKQYFGYFRPMDGQAAEYIMAETLAARTWRKLTHSQ